MIVKKIEREQTLTEKTYRTLLGLIEEVGEEGDHRLPSEEELSDSLGVSRAVVREACNRLNAEGYLTKTERGTVVHPSLFSLRNRIDIEADFYKLVAKNYDRVELKITGVGVIPREKAVVHAWGEEDKEVFTMTWTYFGDGKPVIHGAFEISLEKFKKMPEPDFYTPDLPTFAARYLKTRFSFCVMQIKARLDEETAAFFKVPAESCLQCWDEVLMGADDKPLGYNKFYLHPEESVMTIVVKF